ncbi:hypothetical protein QZH41_006364 [Actinostola sp. cb2023]|nr:hypothetical protein QZH41_006364 [Actinostola sp. cb2023]
MPDINDSNLGPFEESLASFYDYCQMPHGGQKNAEQAQAETAKIFALATTLHKDPAALLSLLEVWRDEMSLWLQFFKKALDDNIRQPTTLKGYSSTLEFYLHFLITREPPSEKYSLSVSATRQLKFLAMIQPKWRTALAKPAGQQRQGQLQKERENLLLVTEMRAVTQSQVFIECGEKLLSLWSSHETLAIWTPVEAKDSILLRNFLIFKLTLSHAGRAGMIANVMLEEFHRRLFNASNRIYEVSVIHHKTQQTGPQKIFLGEKDHMMMAAYIGCVRPTLALASSSSTHLFITETGSRIKSNNVSKVLNSFLKTTGVHLGKPVHSTSIRKMWVSHMAVMEKDEGDCMDLAVLMKHSRTTASRWYDLTVKSRQAERAHAILVMASFDYNKSYSDHQLYSWVIAEIGLTREAGASSLEQALVKIHEYLQISKSQSQRDNMPHIAPVPTVAYLKEVRHSLATLGEKLVFLEASDARKEDEGKDKRIATLEEANKALRIQIRDMEARDTQRQEVEHEAEIEKLAKGEKTKCPVCDVRIFKLKRHLISKKHNWSVKKYNAWVLNKDVLYRLPNKECSISGCHWVGRRLDMHIRGKSHMLKVGSQEYESVIREEREKRSAAKKNERQVLTNVNTEIEGEQDMKEEEDGEEEDGEEEDGEEEDGEEEDGEEEDGEEEDGEEEDGEEEEGEEEEEEDEDEEEEDEEEEEDVEQKVQQEEEKEAVVQRDKEKEKKEDQRKEKEQTQEEEEKEMEGSEDEEGQMDAKFSSDDEMPLNEYVVKYDAQFQPPTQLLALVKAWTAHLLSVHGGSKSKRNVADMTQQVVSISEKMAEACNTAKINRPMFFTAIDIRNWLMFSITVENFNRAGICSNITVKECADAKKIDDHYAIHVSDHKTAGTYGGAIVNLSIDLYSSLKSWMENIRCRMEGEKKIDNVFLSTDGRKVASEQIHQCLKSFAKKTKVLKDDTVKRFSSTMLRKALVTNTRDMSSPEKNNFATMMSHRRSTADRSYHLVDKINRTSEAHRVARQVIEGASNVVEAVSSKTSLDRFDDKESTISTNTIPPSDVLSEVFQSMGYRKSWTSDDNDTIFKKCTDIINGNIPATKSAIYDFIMKNIQSGTPSNIG